MYQKWRDLSFLHYSLDPAELRAVIPNELEIDTFADASGSERAWIGLSPFWMTGVRPRFLPPLPALSTFPETNLRTYVHRDGVPGIWFFSLEAANRIACALARKTLGLPYYRARMGAERKGTDCVYESIRTDEPGAICNVETSIANDVGPAAPGTLEFFLIERYILYSMIESTVHAVGCG
jgi:uncharacterized protein